MRFALVFGKLATLISGEALSCPLDGLDLLFLRHIRGIKGVHHIAFLIFHDNVVAFFVHFHICRSVLDRATLLRFLPLRVSLVLGLKLVAFGR